MRLGFTFPAAALLAVSALVGCATTTEVPNERMTQTQASVRGAEEVGAQRVAPAALHLQYARDQIRQAQALIDDGEFERASYTLDRARADAELAISLAKEQPLRIEAERALRQVQSMRRSSP
jgi:hypothetical protein